MTVCKHCAREIVRYTYEDYPPRWQHLGGLMSCEAMPLLTTRAEPEAAVSEGDYPKHAYMPGEYGCSVCGCVEDNYVAHAQPQPAGTEIENEIALVSDWFEGHPNSAVIEELAARSVKFQTELAALQQSHDACVEAAKDFADFVESEPDIFQIADPTCNLCTQGCTPISHDKGLCSFHRLRAAIANAEKLRAA